MNIIFKKYMAKIKPCLKFMIYDLIFNYEKFYYLLFNFLFIHIS